MFRKVLIATDQEEGLDRLARCLPSLQQGGFDRVIMVHSVEWEDGLGLPEDPTPKIEAAKRLLEQTCYPIPTGFTVEVVVEAGHPSDVIQAALQKFEPDLLILGMSLRNPWVEKLFGSTTVTLLPRISIPILILRPQLIATFTLNELQLRCQQLFRTVLLPCDFTETSQILVTSIVERIQDQGQVQTIRMVHVLDPSSRRHQIQSLESLEQEYTQKLNDLKQVLEQKAPQIQFQSEVRVGSPVKEIMAAAVEADATVIATASRHTGNFWEWSIGSTTGELLHKSWHSILFFPYPALKS